jgi:hypothetical protein
MILWQAEIFGFLFFGQFIIGKEEQINWPIYYWRNVDKIDALVEYLEWIARDRRERRCETARRWMVVDLRQMEAHQQPRFWGR